MKFRKITLSVAAAALALPAALATASSGASAASGTDPLCLTNNPTLFTVCNVADDTHSATFSGWYHALDGSFNDTNETVNGVPGTCDDGSEGASVPLCRLTFLGGDPATACTRNTTTSWSKPKLDDNAWTFYPDKNDLSKSVGSRQLFAEGGGVVDNTITTTDQYGNVLIYRVHIQIHGLCGADDTAQGALNDISARTGLPSVDLSTLKTLYKFTGYVDIL